MIKILFMIPNLGHGGAEKVLVNLVNSLSSKIFDITVLCLYDEGINKQYLSKNIKYSYCFKKSFKGIAHLLKIFSPNFLYEKLIKNDYDIVISFLEGQTARIISGCQDKNTKKICWIHKTIKNIDDASSLFRNKKEAEVCYSQFDKIISVSEDVQNAFMNIFHLDDKGIVLYNVNDTDKILLNSREIVNDIEFDDNAFYLFGMGTLFDVKGFDRFIKVHKKLREDGLNVHSYILGEGPDKNKLLNLIKTLNIEDSFTLLGYQTNPYKYLSHANVFICSSYSEGFSTAVTEALILGVPVVTTHVSGMKELLGDNEYGIICQNSEEGLYSCVKKMLEYDTINLYKKKAIERGQNFKKDNVVKKIEDFLKEV